MFKIILLVLWYILIRKSVTTSNVSARPTDPYGYRYNSGSYVGYKGCWNNPRDQNVLHPGIYEDVRGMSVQRCVQGFCRHYGYKYAGLVNGTVCLCGNNDDYSRYGSTGDRTCRTKCPMQNAEFCGGINFASVYETGSCPELALPGGQVLGERHGGPLVSRTYKQVAYFRCNAGKTLVGASSLQCVDDNAADKFSVKWSQPLPVCEDTPGYKGCFKDNAYHIFELEHKFQDYTSQTVNRCKNLCKDKGFRYAGLEHAFECWCGNENLNYGILGTSNNCTMYCSGDYTQICGGQMAFDLYETSVCPDLPFSAIDGGYIHQQGHYHGNIITFECRDGKMLNGSHIVTCSRSLATVRLALNWKPSFPSCIDIPTYVGCFEARRDQTLFNYAEIRVEDRQNMTTPRCIQHCTGLKYQFASLKYGYECNCGNNKEILVRSDNLCGSHCSGDSSTVCGGQSSMSLYQAYSYPTTPNSASTSELPQKHKTTPLIFKELPKAIRTTDTEQLKPTTNVKESVFVYVNRPHENESKSGLQLVLVITFVCFGLFVASMILVLCIFKRKFPESVCNRLCKRKKRGESTRTQTSSESMCENIEVNYLQQTCSPVFDVQISPNGAYVILQNSKSAPNTPKLFKNNTGGFV